MKKQSLCKHYNSVNGCHKRECRRSHTANYYLTIYNFPPNIAENRKEIKDFIETCCRTASFKEKKMSANVVVHRHPKLNACYCIEFVLLTNRDRFGKILNCLLNAKSNAISGPMVILTAESPQSWLRLWHQSHVKRPWPMIKH